MIPFTVLTGFLGAGKTTALNRMLAAQAAQAAGGRGSRRVAVLVNELGRVGIDGRLIAARGGDLLELAGGCVCCKVDVKNDLWDGIADVIARSAPDQVVLETTGIAEPPALLAGLARLPEPLAGQIQRAGVVCVLDVETAADVLGRREEARVQVESADRVLLSKLDRATPEQVAAAHRLLDQLGPMAERASFPASSAGDQALAEFLLAARGPAGAASAAPATGHDHPHRHGQLVAACFVDAAPLVPALLLAAVEALRPRLVRAKGFVHLAGDPRRAHLELAGTALELAPGAPWGADPPRTELVLIGDELDEPALQRRLWACRAGG